MLALAGRDRILHVWDLVTGADMASFKGPSSRTNAIAFAGDNKRLASGATDTTALIWDLEKLKAPAPLAIAGTPEESWQALAGSDGPKAFQAICALAAAPKKLSPF